MKLRIIDYGWGIDRRSGERSESVCAEVNFHVKEGALPPVGPEKKVFKITKVGEDSVSVWLSDKQGEATISIGKPYEYRPLSIDGGHYYRFELEE